VARGLWPVACGLWPVARALPSPHTVVIFRHSIEAHHEAVDEQGLVGVL
jgi:hypothetical protein